MNQELEVHRTPRDTKLRLYAATAELIVAPHALGNPVPILTLFLWLIVCGISVDACIASMRTRLSISIARKTSLDILSSEMNDIENHERGDDKSHLLRKLIRQHYLQQGGTSSSRSQPLAQ
jgi:hypothetical protein